MSKIITVFGATGNQGSSVINSILVDPVLLREFSIRGITRNSDSPEARKLTERGVEMVIADLSSPSTLTTALQNTHTVFLMTNFWEYLSREAETTQGKNVVDACIAVGSVQHLIFSSTIDVTEATGGRLTHVKHFDGKAEIERYITDRAAVLPATFVHAGVFMSNIFDPTFMRKVKTDGQDGRYELALVVGDEARLPMFDAATDTGKFVKAAIKNRSTVLGKRIQACTDYYAPSRIAREFAEVMGKPTKLVRLSPEEHKASVMFPNFGQELYETFQLMVDPGYYAGADLTESLALLEQEGERPTSWREFVAKNREKWL